MIFEIIFLNEYLIDDLKIFTWYFVLFRCEFLFNYL